MPRRGFALILGFVAIAAPALAQPPAAKAPARPSYGTYVTAWHAVAAGRVAPTDAAGRKKLVLYALNTQERVELAAEQPTGAFAAHELERAAHLLREPSSGNEHPVEPRILDVLYKIQLHFDAQEIRVVSGYRTPRGGASNHGRGRAIDVVVPGTTDDDVAKFAREIGFMGVGIYPVSGFVHVDVRDKSYFWIDASGPGKKNRERGILADVAARADAAALARGEHGVPALVVAPDVDQALRATGVVPVAAPPLDDDDDD
jgi:uncharacterized protein YcbK (DUF882 family)